MRLRFRDIAPSAAPGFPFMPGQVIDVAELSAEMHDALRTGKAELVKDEAPEEAVMAPPERAIARKSKRR